MMRFENSCLQGYLVRHTDGSMILRGHRIRDSSSDHIRDNESIIGSFLEKQELVATAATTDLSPPPDLPDGLAPRTIAVATDDNNIMAIEHPEFDTSEFIISVYALDKSIILHWTFFVSNVCMNL